MYMKAREYTTPVGTLLKSPSLRWHDTSDHVFFLLYKRQKQLPLENTLTIQCVAQVSLSNDNVSCILSRKDTIKPCKMAFTKHYLSNSQFLELTNGSTH